MPNDTARNTNNSRAKGVINLYCFYLEYPLRLVNITCLVGIWYVLQVKQMLYKYLAVFKQSHYLST